MPVPRLTPGQLALPFDIAPVDTRKPARRKPARRPDGDPELDLGPLVRRPKPKPGPRWPKFHVVRETVEPEPDAGP